MFIHILFTDDERDEINELNKALTGEELKKEYKETNSFLRFEYTDYPVSRIMEIETRPDITCAVIHSFATHAEIVKDFFTSLKNKVKGYLEMLEDLYVIKDYAEKTQTEDEAKDYAA